MPETATLGSQFATALAEKDFDRLRGLFHQEVDFRGMTPNRFWEASDPDTVEEVLQLWFEPSDEIEALDALETHAVADRERVGYQFSVRNPDGEFVVEQQAYVSARDGKIEWMRVMCSGFRPAQ
jgi:ketosteroid isomerase-like protein